MRLARWKRWTAAGVIGAAACISAVTHAQALKEGDQAPAFSAPSSTGRTLALKDFQGKVLVLWFYIGAFTKT